MKRLFWIFVFFVGLTGSVSAQLMGGLIIPQPPFANQYPSGTVFCASGPTAIVDVINPTTGRTWMDRNLGASQLATSSTDALAYGDLYQWGRRADGHQCRNSATTTILSTTDQPGHGDFILAPDFPADWRSTTNNSLWQGVNGVNNPCPIGYRLPTEAELNAERLSWSNGNSLGAFNSPLRFTKAGSRRRETGAIVNINIWGVYWSSTVTSFSRHIYFDDSTVYIDVDLRANGRSVRCIKN